MHLNIVAVVLASTLTCQPVPDGDQIGFWEAARKTTGGMANNVEFRADGSYSRAMAVLVDFVYKVEEDILYTAPADEKPVEFKNGTPVKTSRDAYTIVNNEGVDEVRKRIGSGEPDSIIGVYSYRHYTGVMAYEKFTEDGSFHLRIPMRVEHGCYSIEGEEMRLKPENKPPYETYFYFEENQLVLDDFDRKSPYDPVPAGAWYHVDEVDYVKPVSFTPEN